MKGQALFKNLLCVGEAFETLTCDGSLFPYLHSNDNNKLLLEKQPK